jgi:hypothetical protein
MAKNGEKLIFIPNKSLLNSNKHPHSTPPPEFVKYSPFFIDESGKKAHQGETGRVRQGNILN